MHTDPKTDHLTSACVCRVKIYWFFFNVYLMNIKKNYTHNKFSEPPPAILNFQPIRYIGRGSAYIVEFQWNFASVVDYRNHIEIMDVELIQGALTDVRFSNLTQNQAQFQFDQTNRFQIRATNCAGSILSSELVLEGKN